LDAAEIFCYILGLELEKSRYGNASGMKVLSAYSCSYKFSITGGAMLN